MSLVDQSREPLRPVVADDDAYGAVLQTLADASGPVAFDVERAHGYRYWPKAYLFQIRREGAGTWLIDPTKFDSGQLGQLVTVTEDAEWIIHASSQDLPSMYEVGVVPTRIFDTELAARLLTKPGASLGALLLDELDIELRKAHSAVNWATRPLKESWLTYAALDVDFLIELRDVLAQQLVDMRRDEWARQEFNWSLAEYAREPEPRAEPWRRLSRVTSIRHARGLAVARELWLERDAIAQRRDRPPGHILHDSVIVDLATRVGRTDPLPDRADLSRMRGFDRPPGTRYLANWAAAVARVAKMGERQFPSKRPPSTGAPPSPRSWDRARPEAAERYNKVRPAVDEMACEIGVQPSIFAPPKPLQEVLWAKSRPTGDDLLQAGMRPWQADLLSGLLDEIFG